jgi:thioredoxin reductase (NADPH)
MIYDVIVIGKGPAGISASLYTQRANLNTLIIGENNSALAKAKKIENYYGMEEAPDGETLLRTGEKQAVQLGAKILADEVTGIMHQYDENLFEVTTASGKYKGRAMLIATGQPHKQLNIKNLKEFEGKGVSYCTTCDGFFYKGQRVGVLGYNNYAVHEAMELQAFTNNITLYTNGKALDVSANYANAVNAFNINTKTIASIDGDQLIKSVSFENGDTETLDGLFVAYGTASSVDFAKKFGIETNGNAIEVDCEQKTNIDGIFAAGDCTGGFKQIATAVGQGAVAGKSTIVYVRSLKNGLLSA